MRLTNNAGGTRRVSQGIEGSNMASLELVSLDRGSSAQRNQQFYLAVLLLFDEHREEAPPSTSKFKQAMDL